MKKIDKKQVKKLAEDEDPFSNENSTKHSLIMLAIVIGIMMVVCFLTSGCQTIDIKETHEDVEEFVFEDLCITRTIDGNMSHFELCNDWNISTGEYSGDHRVPDIAPNEDRVSLPTSAIDRLIVWLVKAGVIKRDEDNQ